MASLSTTFLGLVLKNPIIVGSSGLTNTVDKISKLERAGAGAVVLKSLFEEQINMESSAMLKNGDYPEAGDYILNYTRTNSVDEYLLLIENAKKNVDIPIIASINCVSSADWIDFSKKIQQAGADAIELNVYFLPTSIHDEALAYEQIYLDILRGVEKKIDIPISVKIGQHFTHIPAMVNKLYSRGAKGAVLFNRFYCPDIDIDRMTFTSAEVYSYPSDLFQSLRWVGIVSSLVERMDICASSGVHDGAAVIKQLLAGAKAVQLCSAIYKKGIEYIPVILNDLKQWMVRNNYKNIEEFRGRMSYKNIADPSIFERSQFMKYYSGMQ